MDEVGLDVESQLETWIAQEDVASVQLWLAGDSRPSDLARDWSDRCAPKGRSTTPLAEAVRESVLCARIQDLAPSLTQFGGAARAIRLSREHLAFSLEKESGSAKGDLRQQRKLLRLAITYFRQLLDEAKWNPELGSPRVACRFSKCILRLARIDQVSEDEIEEARERLVSIRDSEEAQDERARSFLLESYLRTYEHSHTPEDLARAKEVLDLVEQEAGFESGIVRCEYWCRVADESRNMNSREFFLSKASEALSGLPASETSGPTRQATVAVLEGFIEGLRRTGSTGALRLFSVPFVTRRLKTAVEYSSVTVLSCVLESVSPDADSGEYVFREIAADIHSAIARATTTEADERLKHLSKALAYREGKHWQKALATERSGIDQALDHLEYYRLTGSERERTEAIRFLLAHTTKYPQSPHGLAQLGAQAEEFGPYNPVIPVPKTGLVDPELVRAIRNGSAKLLYERAARRALEVGTLPQKKLGGRGSSTLIDERSGRSQFTLVIKTMAKERFRVDLARSIHLEELLRGLDTEEFGVIEHIAHYEIDDDELGPAVVSVRRHEVGKTLADLMTEAPGRKRELLLQATRYLALIHSNPYRHEAVSGVRKELKERELGCWLRRIVPREMSLEFFNRWWALLPSDIPMFERRDAHAHNWIVDTRSRLLALDLESTGWRPAGYELAQLLEDGSLLTPEDSELREELLETYAEALRQGDVSVSYDDLCKGFEIALIARWVRTLSDADSEEPQRLVATRNLEAFAQRSGSPDIAEMAHLLFEKWSQKTGVARTSGLVEISVGTRRRISRAMAHYLRHDEAAPLTPDGWVDAAVVADALRGRGHPVTPERVLMVAGALGERRFEINGESVRASYGHSRKVKIHLPSTVRPSVPLYHATSTSNLRSILEARDGIRPMTRQFVHLSTDIEVALRAAARRHEATVVAEVNPELLPDLRATADPSTWLTSRVPVSALRVMPVHELESRRLKSTLASKPTS